VPEKPIRWLGSSLEEIRRFPADARRVSGYELRRVQCGLEPSDWKPMPTVGPAVREVRVRTGRQHRVFYVARFSEAVYVLHGFEKKSRKTGHREIEVGRQRFRQLVAA
jgi:phage-related protein